MAEVGPEVDRAVLLEALGELGRHAASEGTWLLFEPLNRYEDHMVNTLDQAVERCQATGTGAVKVVADLFHMNIEEDDLAASIRLALECRLRGAPELVLPETAPFLRDRMPGRHAPALPAGGSR